MSFDDWIGRTETGTDTFTTAHNARLAAIGDHPRIPWSDLAPLGHWTGFTPTTPQSNIDTDGHPRRGEFMPPVDLPQRMWAGGSVHFHGPIPLGAPVRRVSTIADVTVKDGSTGRLVFVEAGHELTVDGTTVLSEVQNIVYKDGSSPTAGVEGRAEPDFSRTLTPDAVLLFRYSAATFNAHRIHYDRDYATGVEGYPDIVVQGPLTATLLLDAASRYRRVPFAAFRFRGRAPMFGGKAMSLNVFDRDGGLSMEAVDESGRLGMTAEVDFA
ncbi:FAS1-like dehydratase domain-containing protein [Rhodococcoides kyotonense]|uniref:3-methylfumaryl-CoA hydratase n=1 Tax=Rhodococcoides kyotonense TaxID=398843 RepID=A0A239MR99_9NOCA|nr:MaoC family dehydratase N-terminal domain-containing protein [Rhodococcus kyotonensis]SNT45000.1 3-methylfumaryl-CoA hydratase [Rhodococcus kyotonensis]